MKKSILQAENKECLICGQFYDLHRHHVFGGTANKKLSEKYGLTVWLCPFHHDMSDEGVHYDREADLEIKRMAQEKAMEHYGWNVEDFIKIFGRSYL